MHSRREFKRLWESFGKKLSFSNRPFGWWLCPNTVKFYRLWGWEGKYHSKLLDIKGSRFNKRPSWVISRNRGYNCTHIIRCNSVWHQHYQHGGRGRRSYGLCDCSETLQEHKEINQFLESFGRK